MLTASMEKKQSRHQSDVAIQQRSNMTEVLHPNDTLTYSTKQPATSIRYHPLLGIWSNFNK
jgi:hypothetical protein